ncbi:uncharacterized protein N7500_001438 [Penicillium coprophilum]|uniref:uncharacterized protein n=1 Tax=Penicillium coprophilum TaxID=36646 RepID=UPI00238334A7|nr:uncharacterized protein N7500_001438 [Penicillium coprophilum]KAJ5173507.1 hypothetical protein N7500_001438 [Penicillium coprophilum]
MSEPAVKDHLALISSTLTELSQIYVGSMPLRNSILDVLLPHAIHQVREIWGDILHLLDGMGMEWATNIIISICILIQHGHRHRLDTNLLILCSSPIHHHHHHHHHHHRRRRRRRRLDTHILILYLLIILIIHIIHSHPKSQIVQLLNLIHAP